jgi:dTDP-4-amino-4,6-dideoxygalactose transaminase
MQWIGEEVRLQQIPLFQLNYDDNEKNAVLSVLESKWLTIGAKTAEFENAFSEYLGGDVFSVAVTNCTAALHLALLANNIGVGDEVIISGLTFVACLNVITLLGAKAVVVDSKSFDDWNVSPEDIENKITPRTKAIIVVHYAGYPCDMDEICKIAQDNNLVLIEDDAHAVGADYKGIKCGVIGDIGCFSFFSNKNLSVGEGGMVTTKNKKIYEKIKLLRSHGMTSLTIDRHNNKAISYDVVYAGMNYRIDEMRSALGIEQLKKLDQNNLKRKQLVEQYHIYLSDIKKLIIPWNTVFTDRNSSYHIFPVLLPEICDRRKIIGMLKDKGIQTSIHYPAFNDFTFYKKIIKEDLKIANEISERVLTLPLYPDMNFDDVQYVSESLKKLI